MAKSLIVSDAGDVIRVCTYIRRSRWDSGPLAEHKLRDKLEAQRRINFYNTREKLDARISCNFTVEDYHCVLTLSDEWYTEDYVILREYLRSFLRRMRYRMKKRGQTDFRYLYVLEGLHGDHRLHIHLLTRQLDGVDELIHSLWHYGESYIKPIKNVEHRSSLGGYLTKEPAKLGRDRMDRNLFVASHSCRKPVVSRYTLYNDEEYSIPEGYVIAGSDRREEYDDNGNMIACFNYMLLRRVGGAASYII